MCDDSWTSTNGRVVCKQLGYKYYVSESRQSSGTTKPGSGRVWMDNVACSRSDLRLQDCSFDGWGNHNCDHSEDVGIICGKCNSDSIYKIKNKIINNINKCLI